MEELNTARAAYLAQERSSVADAPQRLATILEKHADAEIDMEVCRRALRSQFIKDGTFGRHFECMTRHFFWGETHQPEARDVQKHVRSPFIVVRPVPFDCTRAREPYQLEVDPRQLFAATKK